MAGRTSQTAPEGRRCHRLLRHCCCPRRRRPCPWPSGSRTSCPACLPVFLKHLERPENGLCPLHDSIGVQRRATTAHPTSPRSRRNGGSHSCPQTGSVQLSVSWLVCRVATARKKHRYSSCQQSRGHLDIAAAPVACTAAGIDAPATLRALHLTHFDCASGWLETVTPSVWALVAGPPAVRAASRPKYRSCATWHFALTLPLAVLAEGQ